MAQKGRPRKSDDIAKRELITMKATKTELARWKQAVSILGTSQCLSIALDALATAISERPD
jgi:hypothetical protein